MSIENVVAFLRLLSTDASLGAAAQQAAGQPDAPVVLARLASNQGLQCSAGDWSEFTRACQNDAPTDDSALQAQLESIDSPGPTTVWQLVLDRSQGTPVAANAITQVIGILSQPGAAPIVGQIVNTLAARNARKPDGSS